MACIAIFMDREGMTEGESQRNRAFPRCLRAFGLLFTPMLAVNGSHIWIIEVGHGWMAGQCASGVHYLLLSSLYLIYGDSVPSSPLLDSFKCTTCGRGI
jgi:hypothetical protein